MAGRSAETRIKTSAAALTPAMRQYQEQKAQAGDAILLFRMGDFYETFYEDARTASRVLGIALTARSKGDNAVPLAGIPYHALDTYLNKVAISEQVEDAKLAKGVVKRQIVRIVTPGTLTDEALLDERSDNILASIAAGKGGVGLAAVELASGRFRIFDEMATGVLDELVRLRPAELLVDEECDTSSAVARQLHGLCGTAMARRIPYEFTAHHAAETLHKHFGVTTLEGFGIRRCGASVRAAGAIISYLNETQKTSLSHIHRLESQHQADTLLIDHNTWRSLEIDRTLRSEQREGSLLAAIDRTVHSMGARRLARWLRHPLVQIDDIQARQDAVAALMENDAIRSAIRTRLRRSSDIERIAARVALGRATPRDLASLGGTLAELPKLREELAGLDPPLLRRWSQVGRATPDESGVGAHGTP